jgi:hypothetical protein
MSDFPVSVPVFTTLADDVDDVLAAHQNTPNDEITALATLMGALGISQSKSVNLMTWEEERTPSIKLSWVDASTVQASTGMAWVKNQPVGTLGTQRGVRRNTSTTNITVSDLIGGGAFANSTGYYIYANGDAVATTATFKISTSGTTPSGLTLYRLIGGFCTDSSGLIIEESVWSVAGPKVVSYAYKKDQTNRSIAVASAIPADSTKPQTNEGGNYSQLTCQVQGISTSYRIRFRGAVSGFAPAGNGGNITCTLWRDTGSTTDVLATFQVGHGSDSNGSCEILVIDFEMAVPATGLLIFKVSVGASGGTGNFLANQISGGVTYGDLMFSFLQVEVIEK